MATVTYCEKTKEELIKLLQERDRQIEELEKEVSELKKKNQPKFAVSTPKRRRKKKPGRKEGHLGVTREKPDHIDDIIESRISTCPHCNHSLGKPIETFDHTQEDIIPARVKVTCYRKHRYYCKHCKSVITAPYCESEIPHSYVGPNALIQALLLKYHHHLPYNSIRELFQSFAGLNITEGALAQALQRISQWLNVERKAILKAIRSSRCAHMDETGWYIDGRNSWLWELVNKKLAYYHIDPSRGAKVAREMLGNNFRGILISDFYAAYNGLPVRKQKCLVHLLRDMERCRGSDQSEEFLKHYKRLKRILQDAHRLRRRGSHLAPRVFYRRLRLIKERLFDFAAASFSNKHWQRLSKRLLVHYEELLTFLKYPNIPSDNNHAERLIRPNVINRNRSFGNRSLRGAEAHATLMSILQSLRLQDRNIAASFKKAYLAHRKGYESALLF